MTQERFMEILECYGADPQRWPATERTNAMAFAAQNPELIKAAMALEAELDDLLGSAEIAPSEMLEQKILRKLPRPASPIVWGWRAPVAAAAALMIGVALGFAGGAATTPMDDAEALYADAFSGFDDDYVDWLESET
jgi:hypothetical protein